MPAPKCRVDVWTPVISMVTTAGVITTPQRPAAWVKCDTLTDTTDKNMRRANACTSVEIKDGMFQPQIAFISLSNRAHSFKAFDSETFVTQYQDSDGTSITSGTSRLRKNWGPFSHFFKEFQIVRIVDLETHMVLFMGRIYKINKKHDGQRGALVNLVCKDALEELKQISMKSLPKEIEYPVNTPRSSIIQSLLHFGLRYEASLPAGGKDKIQISPTTSALTDSFLAINSDNNATSAAENSYKRFELSETYPANKIRLKARKTGAKNLLDEMKRWAILEPHADETAENQFGYELFVDPNVGSTNLLATVPPPPAMFNYFKRGDRLSSYSSAGQTASVYGLTTIFPHLARAKTQGLTQLDVGVTRAGGNASTTTISLDAVHTITAGQVITIGSEEMFVRFTTMTGDIPPLPTATVVRGWNGTTAASFNSSTTIKENRPAQVLMKNLSFDFDETKDELYTDCILTYERTYFISAVKLGAEERTKVFELLYVTELTNAAADGDADFRWDGYDLDDQHKPTLEVTPGTHSAEFIDVYNTSGTRIAQNSARIQYQSTDRANGATNFAYILLSDIQTTFPTANPSGTAYVELRGASSGAKCRLNCDAVDVLTGRPATAFAGGNSASSDGKRFRRTLALTHENSDDLKDLRQEVASRLAQSTTPMIRGNFSVSKAPYYFADFKVRSIADDGSTGQIITVKSVNGTAAIPVTNYGFREGMVVHKRVADNTATAQANNKDVYGFCYTLASDTSIYVNLTESQNFAVDDVIRLFIPIRAGDVMFVDNAQATIYGEHLVEEVVFNENPIPETSYTTLGENEPRIRMKVGTGTHQNLWNTIAKDNLELNERVRRNFPVGTQTFSFAGTWSYPANNIVQWTAGDLRTSDGTVYQIAASNTSDTTYGLGSNGMTGSNKYTVYLSPEGENSSGNTYHFYTVIATSYLEDDEDIIILQTSVGAIAGKANAVAGPNMDLTKTDTPKWEAFKFAHEDSVSADLIKAATLTGGKLVNNTITVTQIGDNAISTAKIQANAITANEIITNAVTSNKIVAGSIVADKIATDAITATKIEAGAVIAEKLTSNALDSHTITLTGGGKLITSAGAVRDGSNHYLSTDFTSGTNGLLIDQHGILGATGAGASNVEFYLSAADGKGYFGGGVCTIGKLGIFFPSAATLAVGGTLQWGHSSGGGVTGFYKNTGANTLMLNAFGGDAVGSTNAFLVQTWIGNATVRVPQIHVDNIQCHGTATGFGGGGTVTSVDTTVPILGGEITGSGTISHSNAAGYKHIPDGGSSTQVLTYVAPGTATWQAASVHGTHGGGNTFTDGISMTGSNFLLLGSGVVLYTNTPPQFVTGAFIKEMGTPPSTPSSGYGIVYAKTDSKLYFKSDGGTEYDLTGGGGSASFPLLAPDGSGGAPSYSFSDDTNTGMFSLATDKATLVGNGQYCLTADGTSGGGRVGIGSITSPSHVLEISGQGRSTAAAWATSSDERVKENIIDIEPSLDTVLQLKPKRFNFMGSYRPIHEESEVGFIAQEVKEVVPTAITVVEESYGWKQNEEGIWEVDEDNQTIINDFEVLDTSWLFPMLVKAVQELKEQNDGLLARIEALEGN